METTKMSKMYLSALLLLACEVEEVDGTTSTSSTSTMTSPERVDSVTITTTLASTSSPDEETSTSSSTSGSTTMWEDPTTTSTTTTTGEVEVDFCDEPLVAEPVEGATNYCTDGEAKCNNVIHNCGNAFQVYFVAPMWKYACGETETFTEALAQHYKMMQLGLSYSPEALAAYYGAVDHLFQDVWVFQFDEKVPEQVQEHRDLVRDALQMMDAPEAQKCITCSYCI